MDFVQPRFSFARARMLAKASIVVVGVCLFEGGMELMVRFGVVEAWLGSSMEKARRRLAVAKSEVERNLP